MPVLCCVKSCRKVVYEGNRGFKIPEVIDHHCSSLQEKEILRREAWLRSLRLKESDVNRNSRVCASHFCSGI
jgi:hypothetical protein